MKKRSRLAAACGAAAVLAAALGLAACARPSQGEPLLVTYYYLPG